MAAYIVLNIEVTDPARYPEYTKLVQPTLDKYGGTFIVRGGKAETIEGSIQAKRIVILQFPSYERAKAWWNSDEYREPKALRQRYATGDAILVDGLSEP